MLINCSLAKFVPNQNSRGAMDNTCGAKLGTPGYMCDTCMRHADNPFEVKSEIYSFGIVLLELLTGRLQAANTYDLFATYIELETPVFDDLDIRAGDWIWTYECTVQLEMLARECLDTCHRRIGSMLSVMDRLVSIEWEFCQVTTEEESIVRVTEDLQREVQTLGLQANDHAEAREFVVIQTCSICYDDLERTRGLGCESSSRHFVCADCAPREVQRILQEIQEHTQLERHREQGGRIKCVQPNCDAMYAEAALARVLSDGLFVQYRAAQDAVVENRLYTHFQQRLLAEIESAGTVARTAQEALASAEFTQRQYPNAVQCPRCSAGPVIPENCSNLQTHHGQDLFGGRGHISNACPGCGFFSRDRAEWVRWDGQMR